MYSGQSLQILPDKLASNFTKSYLLLFVIYIYIYIYIYNTYIYIYYIYILYIFLYFFDIVDYLLYLLM